MKGQAQCAFIFLFAVFFVFSFDARSEGYDGGGGPPTCRTALDALGASAREGYLERLLGARLLLGEFQAEALIRVAQAEREIPSGIHLDTGSADVKLNLSRFADRLDSRLTNLTVAEADQVRIANKTLAELESLFAPQETRNFRLRGKMIPDFQQFVEARETLTDVLRVPGGRELMIQALVLTNGATALIVQKSWSRLTQTERAPIQGALIGASAVLGAGALVAGVKTGAPVDYFLHGFEALALSVGATKLGGLLPQTKIVGRTRLQLARALGRVRLKRAVERSLLMQRSLIERIAGGEAEKQPAVAKSASNHAPAAPSAPAAPAEPEVSVAVAERILPDLIAELNPHNADFTDLAQVSDYGNDLNRTVGLAIDVMALLSRRIELFGQEVDLLSLLSERKSPSSSETERAIEATLLSSLKIVDEAVIYTEELKTLETKVHEYLRFGEAALSGRPSHIKRELENALDEIRQTSAFLAPVHSLLPSTIEALTLQSEILRKVRVALRGNKLDSIEAARIVRKAVEDLRKVRDDLTRKVAL